MTKRIAPYSGTVALVSQLLFVLFLGCGGSNGPATATGAGDTTGAGGSASTGAGGSASTGAGGSTSTGAAGSTSTGAAGSNVTGAAGSTVTGAAGSSGTGAAGTTGTTGSAGASGTFGTPACGNTAAAVAIAKGGACTAADTQLCYKSCGPNGSMGVKSETCTAGIYAEMSGCSFPPGVSEACFTVPATQDATCPATAPMASTACTVAACKVCSGAGTTYLDSTGASKTGYCVCVGAAGAGKWSCASTTAWPCAPGVACP
jgi:hypothetical protein